MSSPFTDLATRLRAQGVTIEPGSSHDKLYLGARMIGVLSRTRNSDNRRNRRLLQNTVARCRRLGLTV